MARLLRPLVIQKVLVAAELLFCVIIFQYRETLIDEDSQISMEGV
jgi:hypothetical protein